MALQSGCGSTLATSRSYEEPAMIERPPFPIDDPPPVTPEVDTPIDRPSPVRDPEPTLPDEPDVRLPAPTDHPATIRTAGRRPAY
jgi:hypothetical protein